MPDIIVQGHCSRASELGKRWYVEVLFNEILPKVLDLGVYMERTDDGYLIFFETMDDFLQCHLPYEDLQAKIPELPALLEKADSKPFNWRIHLVKNASPLDFNEFTKILAESYSKLNCNIKVSPEEGYKWVLSYPSLEVYQATLQYLIKKLQDFPKDVVYAS